jgi:hypothetical protein
MRLTTDTIRESFLVAMNKTAWQPASCEQPPLAGSGNSWLDDSTGGQEWYSAKS